MAVWLVVAWVAALTIFLNSERLVVVASHDAVLRPDMSGQVVIRTGPLLPDVRRDSGGRVGVELQLGKTNAENTRALMQRYGYIASQPEGQVKKIEDAVRSMALDAALRGALIGLVPPLLWAFVGPDRRRELVRRIPTRRGAIGSALVVVVVAGLWAPWEDRDDESLEAVRQWVSLRSFLGGGVEIPEELADVQVRGDITTTQTRRLVESAIDTFDQSKEFYRTAAEDAAELELRRPGEDEEVVVLVSDRHDNIGMDEVARAVGDRAGATAVLNAGDDTSTGEKWEAFSLDSVSAAFDDYDERWGVTGNHDHGDFVHDYLDDLGWTMLDGDVVDGPAGSRLLGVNDPRSSGLGNWRDETGLSFAEVEDRITETACEADEDDERIGTILVHDANMASEALDAGCVDLVLGGHTHTLAGPTRVEGENGRVGYTFTNGTTGGAAYAIAIGSKIRRPATISLVTYADGRPAGVQAVTLQTSGRFDVSEYVPLDYAPGVGLAAGR